jgi:ribonuclease HII
VSRANRERLFIDIMDRAISIGIGIVDEKVIDEINILEATKLAMKKSIKNLDIKPELLLIDALKLDDIDIKQFGIIKGDMKSISIAAASIIAKVTRDRIMYGYNKKYPEYGFLTNVGYGTKEHIDAIKKNGYTEIHRKTFIKNFIE